MPLSLPARGLVLRSFVAAIPRELVVDVNLQLWAIEEKCKVTNSAQGRPAPGTRKLLLEQ